MQKISCTCHLKFGTVVAWPSHAPFSIGRMAGGGICGTAPHPASAGLQDLAQLGGKLGAMPWRLTGMISLTGTWWMIWCSCWELCWNPGQNDRHYCPLRVMFNSSIPWACVEASLDSVFFCLEYSLDDLRVMSTLASFGLLKIWWTCWSWMHC